MNLRTSCVLIMGFDIFASYSESFCTALINTFIFSLGTSHEFITLCYSLLISWDIIVGFVTALFTINSSKIEAIKEIKTTLEKLLPIFNVLMTLGFVTVKWVAPPSLFRIATLDTQRVIENGHVYLHSRDSLWI